MQGSLVFARTAVMAQSVEMRRYTRWLKTRSMGVLSKVAEGKTQTWHFRLHIGGMAV
jgi:hypothetical protein